jgi:signal transduction histidine kinase/FixJ family two-component response regulator
MTAARVLIVDDDTALLQALPETLTLRMNGVAVDTCESAVAALEQIAATDYDAIVTDIKMPGMDGLALLARIRALQPNTPTLLITGHGEHELTVQALRGGAYDFVQKPIDRDYFVASLGRAIQMRQLSRRVQEQTRALERHATQLEQTVQERTRELRKANRLKDQLYVREQVARAEAEAAQQHSSFLAEASKQLAGSLDYQVTLASLARLAVPMLADRCVVYMLEESGQIRRVETVHADPAKAELLLDIQRRYLVSPEAPEGVAKVLRTGQPELIPEVSDAWLESFAHDREHYELLRALGPKSYMFVPLVARGRTLGAIAFVSVESGRRYSPRDLALADDLGRRAGVAVDNARLYRQAQEAIQARDEFLSIASHELKTPLTSLQAHVQMLLRGVQKGQLPAAEQLEKRLERAEQASKRLVQLINGLLDVSRISAGRLELEPERVELVEVVREVAARFGPELAEAGCVLQLIADSPTVGNWDRFRVEQVLNNLLSNAVKYGPGRPIQVRVEAEEGTARLAVRDFGIGIAPEQIERIFARFERAVPARNYGGLGLGLYIVRQIVEAHGGTIQVESQPGAGSTFTVELPQTLLAINSRQAAARALEQSQAARRGS